MSSERAPAATATPAATGTQTQTTAPPSPPPAERAPDGTLRLRGGPIEDRRVRWNEDVIDNEDLGRKSSKGARPIPLPPRHAHAHVLTRRAPPVCCIYHRPRAVGESSDEDSSDSDSDDSGADDGGARPANGAGGHSHKGPCKPRKNAYEKMPKPAGLKRKK